MFAFQVAVKGTKPGDFPDDGRFGQVLALKRHDKGARIVHADGIPVDGLLRGIQIESQFGKLHDVHLVAFQRMFRCVAFVAQISKKAAQGSILIIWVVHHRAKSASCRHRGFDKVFE